MTPKITINNCPRCGAGHTGLAYFHFGLRPPETLDGTRYYFWALCPFTGNPLWFNLVSSSEIVKYPEDDSVVEEGRCL